MKIKLSSNRNFGLVFFIIFLIISFYPLLNNENVKYWSLIVSIIFLILGTINSKLLTPLNKAWTKFGLFLGRIMTPVVMALIFFMVVTPTSFILKIVGKDVLRLKKTKSKSYWLDKEEVKSSMKDQF